MNQDMQQVAKAPYKGMMAGGGNLVDFMNVSTEDKEVKETEMNHKLNKKDQLAEVTRKMKKELELTQEELDAALEYYEKLKPDCVDQGLSYEDRRQNRKDEIESLKEALRILAGEDLA